MKADEVNRELHEPDSIVFWTNIKNEIRAKRWAWIPAATNHNGPVAPSTVYGLKSAY
jgi:hypothetical protein